MEIISLLGGTVMLRPYVFIFLAIYGVVAWHQIGWKRTLLWTVSGYLVAFLAEFSSIHWGFPFGDYYYIDTTRDQELWVAGVPFMDSLSFTFLTYTGYSCAWQLVTAFKCQGRPQETATYLSTERTLPVLVIGALITMLMDVIIDPVSLKGGQWFLGQIYGYTHDGFYFGIPMTNFGGWLLVAAVIIAINQALAGLVTRGTDRDLRRDLPYIHLGGFLLFLLIVAFNLVMALWLQAYLMFLSGLSIVVVSLFLFLKILAKGRFLAPDIGGGKVLEQDPSNLLQDPHRMTRL